MQADGWSLDDKRQPLLRNKKLGPTPSESLTDEEHKENNLPDIAVRWKKRDGTERQNPRTSQSFCVPKADIAASGYDLSLKRYKETVHEKVTHATPGEIIEELKKLEFEIEEGLQALKEMVG
jgi:type I restriction enzyme M protein